MRAKRLVICKAHLDLLARANVGWEASEFGAPGLDPKRPYGNSDVYRDLGEIVGVRPPVGEDEHTDEQRAVLRAVHEQMRDVLQILVRRPCAGLAAGQVYERAAAWEPWEFAGVAV